MPVSEAYLIDCMEYMRTMPDKYFDLAVVDPPYQIGNGRTQNSYRGAGKLAGRVMNKQASKFEKWDIAPTQEYFDELFRVSKNQIIWGGNYFQLPPTRCVICWDKQQPWENFSQVEIAWTSFNTPAKIFRLSNRTYKKIHPTQKPVQLYSWIIEKFGGGCNRLLDTHLGSQSSRIAAWNAGLDFYGCEIDKDYYESGCERFERECRTIVQPQLFDI